MGAKKQSNCGGVLCVLQQLGLKLPSFCGGKYSNQIFNYRDSTNDNIHYVYICWFLFWYISSWKVPVKGDDFWKANSKPNVYPMTLPDLKLKFPKPGTRGKAWVELPIARFFSMRGCTYFNSHIYMREDVPRKCCYSLKLSGNNCWSEINIGFFLIVKQSMNMMTLTECSRQSWKESTTKGWPMPKATHWANHFWTKRLVNWRRLWPSS